MKLGTLSIALAICYLLSPSRGSCQRLKLEKSTFIGGTHQGVFLNGSKPTADNGLILFGSTKDSGTADIPRQSNALNDSGDVVLIKLDSLGNKQWIQAYGGKGNYDARGICQTRDGGYAVASGNVNRLGDFAFDRLDANGNYLWSSKFFGSSRPDVPTDIIETPDNGFLMAGGSFGADGDIPFNYKMPIGGFQPADWVLIKTDSLGNKQWVKVLGTSGDEGYSAVKVLTDGQSYYAIGSTVTKDKDCADSLRRAMKYEGFSIYIMKLDLSGNLVWSKAYGAAYFDEAIFDTRDSTIICVGSGTDGFGIIGYHGGSHTDMMLIKVDRNGNMLWGKLYGDDQQNEGRSAGLAKGPDGGYYLAGMTGNGFAFPIPPYHGNADGWIVQTDNSGNLIAQNHFGGIGDDVPLGVIARKKGCTVVGQSQSANFSEGTGKNYTFSDGSTTRFNAFVSHFQLWSLGISQRATDEPIVVAPNPANQEATVTFAKSEKASIIRCTDVAGKEVFRQTTVPGQNAMKIPMSGWASGTYTVSMLNGMSGRVTSTTLVTK